MSRLSDGWVSFLASSVVTLAVCRAGDQIWPQWQGARRDNVSTETGLLKQWPEGGPKLLWAAAGCGKGYSSVAVTEQRIYTAGISNDQTYVVAFDMEGKTQWRTPSGGRWQAGPKMAWAKSYDGARATPTVNEGLVYHLSEMGKLSALARLPLLGGCSCVSRW